MKMPEKIIFGLTSNEYRPCFVNISDRRGINEKKKALFHKWTYEQEPVESGVMKGSHPAGQLSTTQGIVEMEDGQVLMVMPYLIQFADGQDVFDQFAWRGEK